MRIPITGMSCQGCASTIQEAVSQLEGARNVHANFALKQLAFEGVNTDDVVRALRALGYDSPVGSEKNIFHIDQIETQEKIETKSARNAFILAALLGIPEFIIGMHLILWKVSPVPTEIEATLASLVVLVAGFGIHRRSLKQIIAGHLTMDTLVTMGSAAALIEAFVLYFRGSSMPGFEIASTIVVFILLGRYLEARARRATFSATAELYSALQQPVLRLTSDADEIEISGLEIKPGDRFRLRPGEISPVDGIVISGKAQINEAALTGEPIPKAVRPGSKILSGSTLVDSSLVIAAEEVGQNSFLGRLIVELEKAQGQTVKIQRLADRVTAYFVPAIIVLASLAAIFHFLKGETPEFSFNIFLSVVLTACPCALGLAIPTALVAGLGASAKRGVLFRDASVLEASSDVKEIYFDKTGTITEGKPKLDKIIPADGFKDRNLLMYAAMLAKDTLHPLSLAISEKAKSEGLSSVDAIENLKVIPGEGIEGDAEGLHIVLKRSSAGEDGTSTDIFVNNVRAGRFVFSDSLREEAKEVITEIKNWGFNIHLLTGDSLSSVKKLGLEKMFTTVRAGLNPNDKEFIVRAAREKDPKGVAFVGDGINDVLALNAATVGIAVASGAPAALGAGSLSLVRGIRDLPLAFYFAELTARQLKVNLFWAFGYNMIMLPWAVAGYLHPMWASLAMAMSSVSVVLGSLWLGRRLQNLDLTLNRH